MVFVRAYNKTNKKKLLKTTRVTDILFASHCIYLTYTWVILSIQQQIVTSNELEIKRKKLVFHRFNQPVPTVQLIKRTAEVNGAIIEEE